MSALEWRQRAAAGAVVTGISLGVREALGEQRDEPAIVIEARDVDPDPNDPIVLFFHPEVPEATLVLLRTV